jgi:AraC-like DNA-binding protein
MEASFQLEKLTTVVRPDSRLNRFAEQSSFNHAFRRWTGKAPGDHRKSA